MVARWHRVDEVVYGPAAAPTTYTELDLSSHVGLNEVLVLIDCVPGATVGGFIRARTNGATLDGAYSLQCAQGNPSVADSSILVATDSNGVIEWECGSNGSITLKLVGYIDGVTNGSGTTIDTGTLPSAAWTELDASSIIGATKALCILHQESTNTWNSPSDYRITRPHSASGTWDNNSQYARCLTNKIAGLPDNRSATSVAVSDSNGKVEVYSDTGNEQADIEVQHYITEADGWEPVSGNVFGPAAAPTSFTDLDLSSVVGEQETIVLLKVTKSTGSVNSGASFRPNGSTYNWDTNGRYSVSSINWVSTPRSAMCLCPTDENGVIEWYSDSAQTFTIDVIGYLSSAPEPSAITTDFTELTSGKIVAFLEIPGFGVLSTDTYVPGEDWFQNHYNSDYLFPWLEFDFKDYKETIDFVKAELRISGMRCMVADIRKQFTEKLKSHKVSANTRLITSVSAGDTTFSCTYAGDFLSTGYAFIGQECVNRTGISSNTFTVERAKLGTVAQDYDVDLTSMPPVQPTLTDGMESLTGRRAVLRFAVLDEVADLLGPTTVVYRGTIKKGMRRKGASIEIPLEHVWNTVKKNIGSRMPNSQIINGQYWYSGNFDPGLSGWNMRRYNYTTADEEEGPVTIGSGWYNFNTLHTEVSSAFTSASFGREVDLRQEGGQLVLYADDQAGYTWQLWIREGSPLWALGFEAGAYESERGGTLEIRSVRHYTRNFVVDWQSTTGYSNNPKIKVADASVFTANTRATVGKSGYAKIQALSTDTNFVHFYSNSFDSSYDDKGFWSKAEDDRTKEEQATLQSVFAFGGNLVVCRLSTALKRMLGLDSTASEPSSWCANGMLSADIDFTSLDDAVDGLPAALRYYDDCIKDGKQVWSLIGPQLGLLGICPRCGDNNVVEFVRINTPMDVLAEVTEVDDSIWEITEASEVETRDDDAPLLNLIEVKHSRDYTKGDKGEYGVPIKIYNDDALHVFGETRKVTYDCPGLRPHIYGVSLHEFAEICRQETIGTHFGVWGRDGYTTDIPVTWPGKQVKCGEYRKLTHECVHDIGAGDIGVDSKLCLAVAREWKFSGSGTDSISVRIAPVAQVGGIAPCAHMTSYLASTATGTFTVNPVFSDSADDDLVPFNRYNVSTVWLIPRNYGAFSSYQAVISTMNRTTREVTFSSDVLSTDWGSYSTDGMYMTFGTWSTATSTMQVYAFIADLSTNPTLGPDEDDPYEWSI